MRIQKLNYQSKIWKNTQNYVFQEKKWAYYLTRIVELAFCVGFMIIRTDFLTRILLLIVLIIPIRGLIFPMSLIANDKGITIWGFGNESRYGALAIPKNPYLWNGGKLGLLYYNITIF